MFTLFAVGGEEIIGGIMITEKNAVTKQEVQQLIQEQFSPKNKGKTIEFEKVEKAMNSLLESKVFRNSVLAPE